MSVHLRSALASTFLFAAAATASACGTGKIVFTDTFDMLNQTTWGAADDHMSVANGEMILGEQDGKFYPLYADPIFRGIDYCANIKLTNSSDIPASYGGVTFWVRNADHFYSFEVTLDGYATVQQYDGKWTSLIDDRAFAGIKQGVGAINELRVVTKGPSATFYVNDQKFDSISDKTAPGTSHIGLVAGAAKNGKATFAFEDTVVREVVQN